MSKTASFSFVDDDDVVRASSTVTLACPSCGETEVGAALDGVIVENAPNSCPLGTEGPWLVVPMMCADIDCGEIFGLVFATDGTETQVGYAMPNMLDSDKQKIKQTED